LRPIVMAGVGVVVVFLAFLLLGRGPATEDEAGLALAGTNAAGGPGFLSVDSAAAAQPAPPTDLAPLADRALATFAARIQGAVDSLRIVHAVDGAPPPPWLSGPYLADARQYPEARDFWVGYGRLVAD